MSVLNFLEAFLPFQAFKIKGNSKYHNKTDISRCSYNVVIKNFHNVVKEFYNFEFTTVFMKFVPGGGRWRSGRP